MALYAKEVKVNRTFKKGQTIWVCENHPFHCIKRERVESIEEQHRSEVINLRWLPGYSAFATEEEAKAGLVNMVKTSIQHHEAQLAFLRNELVRLGGV